jgi:hypothetical protein
LKFDQFFICATQLKDKREIKSAEMEGTDLIWTSENQRNRKKEGDKKSSARESYLHDNFHWKKVVKSVKAT